MALKFKIVSVQISLLLFIKVKLTVYKYILNIDVLLNNIDRNNYYNTTIKC